MPLKLVSPVFCFCFFFFFFFFDVATRTCGTAYAARIAFLLDGAGILSCRVLKNAHWSPRPGVSDSLGVVPQRPRAATSG